MQYPNIFMEILQRRGIIRIIQMELLEWVRNSLLGIWMRVPTHCSAFQSILEKEGFFHANWCIVHSFYNSFSSLLTFVKCGCVQHFSSIKTSDFDRSWKCLPGLAVVLPRTPFLLPKLPPDKPATRSTSSKTKNPKHSNIYPASPLSSIPSPIPPTQKRKLSSTDTGPVPKKSTPGLGDPLEARGVRERTLAVADSCESLLCAESNVSGALSSDNDLPISGEALKLQLSPSGSCPSNTTGKVIEAYLLLLLPLCQILLFILPLFSLLHPPIHNPIRLVPLLCHTLPVLILTRNPLSLLLPVRYFSQKLNHLRNWPI